MELHIATSCYFRLFFICLVDVLKIDAQALHDYNARSDKELSFKRGDLLQVIEKTPDNNWWDGFIQGKRGFIPVAYIEILELKPVTPELASPQPVLNVPPPPLRRSSMPVPESSTESKVISNSTTKEVILEEREPDNASPEEPQPPTEETREQALNTPELRIDDVEEKESSAIQEPSSEPQGDVKAQEEQILSKAEPKTDVKTQPETKKPDVSVRSGAVKSLTQQFNEPPPQQRVLVEPHHTHKRQQSEQLKKPVDGGEIHPRTASSGSKVGMLSSAFETRASTGPPPPIKPKPINIPTSPITEQQQQAAMAFPLMSHPHQGGYPSVSPLQRAAHISQAGKPAPPPQPQQQQKKQLGKGSGRAPKRDKGSFKSPEKSSGGKAQLPPKPPTPAKPSYVPPPGMMGGLHSKDLKEEMQARLKKQHGGGDN